MTESHWDEQRKTGKIKRANTHIHQTETNWAVPAGDRKGEKGEIRVSLKALKPVDILFR